MGQALKRIAAFAAALLIVFGTVLIVLPAAFPAHAAERTVDDKIDGNRNNPELPKGYKEPGDVLDLSKGVSAGDFSEDKVDGLCLYPIAVFSQRVEDLMADFEEENGSWYSRPNSELTLYENQGLWTEWDLKDAYSDNRFCITREGPEEGYALNGVNVSHNSGGNTLKGASNSRGFYRSLYVRIDGLYKQSNIIISDPKFEGSSFSVSYSGKYDVYVRYDTGADGFLQGEEEQNAYRAYNNSYKKIYTETIEVNSRSSGSLFYVTKGGKLVLRIDNGDLTTYFRVDGIKPHKGGAPVATTNTVNTVNTADPEPVKQEVVTPGGDKPGEDGGIGIKDGIVENKKDRQVLKGIGTAVGGIIAAGGIGALISGAKKGKEEAEGGEAMPSSYRMYVKKDFGNVIKKGAGPKFVYARIAEVLPGGGEKWRDDLSARIEVFSPDGALEVTDGGFDKGYKAAKAEVAYGNTESEGSVSFRFRGEGGEFIRHVVFRLTEAQIIFPQENLGLPACKLRYVIKKDGSRIGDGEYRLPFYVKDMPVGYGVKAEIKRVGSTDIKGGYIPASKIAEPVPYTVEIIPDPEDGDKDIWLAVIRETGEYGLAAGLNEGFELDVTAEYGKAGDSGYEKVSGKLPVYRIHLGLSFTVETNSIPCYLKLKPGSKRKERDQITNDDLEAVYAKGSLMLFLCDENDLSIVRVPVSPQMEADGKRPKKLKLTPTKVGNDRYSKTGDAGVSHQALVDALGICAFPTGRLNSLGGHEISLCATSGALDVPTRLLADVEITAEYNGKVYSACESLLLRSQEFRVAKNAREDREFLEEDKHIGERLLRINLQIEHDYSYHLMSLSNMIDRMLDGYDPRFGYDPGQVENVMNTWVGFLEGTFAGANGTPKGITFGDELEACYAFMQGLRDNTGFLGRVAMGVMTAGYSEYLFSTMTLAEEMHQKVFSCKGDKDFGFWDGVQLGVNEFGKQIILEVTTAGLAEAGGAYLASATNIDIPATLAGWGKGYRSAMDTADTILKDNFRLYKAADDAFQGCKNFFNSSAKTTKAAIDETIKSADQAEANVEQLLKKARKDMTPEELAKVDKYMDDMSNGMEKVRKLQKAQQEMDSITDPAALKEAKANYRKLADEVWTDKYALRQLQRNRNPYAQKMRAQFNEYRETLLDEVQLEALDDIAKETGIPREELYVMNASGNTKANIRAGKKTPSDRDISFKQKVLSDRTRDLTIDQKLGERAVARRLYKKMNGKEADTIEEALEFMKGKDVSYVNPEKSSAGDLVFERNLEAYEDLTGMIGMKPDGTIDKSLMAKDLHNKVMNQKAVAHKGIEWYRRGDIVEGTYQITKQVDNIIIPRGVLRTGKNPLPQKAMDLHKFAQRVGYDVSPEDFIHVLKNDYGLTLEGYADYMSKFLD